MDTLAGLRVLVVEDEGAVAFLIESLLEDLGCQVVASVGRVSAAVPLARSAQLDIAVLDVNVAGEKVFPVCDALAARGIPFVFSTGYGAAGIRADLAGHPVIAKPFTQTELHDALSLAVQRRLAA